MKKPILLFSALLLSSCTVNVVTSSNDDYSDEEEDSSAQSISEPVASSSEEKKENKISLYNPTSHLYATTDIEEKSPFLKTYRHKDHDDVPYVDLDEFQHVRRYIDSTLKYFNLVKLDDGRYDLVSSYYGHCYFDIKEQKVELVEVESLYGEFSDSNDNFLYDPCIYGSLVHGSAKTKYLHKGEKTVYDLRAYQMEIVEENNHLYVPFSLATHLLVNPTGYSLVYNGKDFYNSKLILPDANYMRPFSNDQGFLWSYAGDTKSRTHFARKDPKEGESYRFEGTIEGLKGGQDPVEAVFKKDGTLTFHSDDLMETVNYTGTWTEKNQIITANLKSVDGFRDPQTQHIDLREGGYYRVEKRSQAMAKAHYYQLCMDFDYQYGLKEFIGVTKFDDEFTKLGYKEKLLSLDNATYYDALSKFLYGGKMGDGHTTLLQEGFSSLRPNTILGTAYADVAGERINGFASGMSRAGQAKANLGTACYNVENVTAVISFSEFSTSLTSPFLGIGKYVIPEDTQDRAAFINKEMSKDVVRGICFALNEVSKNTSIKNVVFDVCVNRGGYALLVPFLSSIMTDDPMVIYENSISNSRVEAHYSIDLNGDGVYGGEGDTWKGKYNYFVIQGSGSFSAGNIFPTTAKNGGYAVTIGEPTLGGGCGIARRADITGYTYLYNGNFGFPEKRSDGSFRNSEGRTSPMVEMDINDVYDLKKLDAKLAEINQKASA